MQFGPRQPMGGQPVVRHVPQPLRTAGQPDDVVLAGQVGHEARALRAAGTVGGAEERG